MSVPTLGIAIPCRDQISATAFKHFAQFFMRTTDYWKDKHGPEAEVILATQTRCHVHIARWFLLSDLLDSGCTHICWLDDDACPTPDLVEKLLVHGKDIVAPHFTDREGKRVAKTLRVENGKYVTGDVASNEFCRVGVTGFHALLMTREAALKVIAAAGGMSPFQFPTTGRMMDFGAIGEDHWFFRYALHAGVQLWLDPTVSVGHVGEKVYE